MAMPIVVVVDGSDHARFMEIAWASFWGGFVKE
jgi:hypothetical protein